MTRVTYLVSCYPTFAETYISTELSHVRKEFEVDVIAVTPPEEGAEADVQYVVEEDEAKILERTSAFAPDVIHTHWLWGSQFDIACRLAKRLDRPLTIRTHSFDVLGIEEDGPSSPTVTHRDFLGSEYCLGILTFPFGVERLARAGMLESKLIPCRPVVDYERFYDESPNGSGVVNVGACLAKKDFPSYLHLARRVPEKQFGLYPVGPYVAALRETNRTLGSPVEIHAPVQHHQMPAVYKRHEWLVYTADRRLATVGWPICIAEAQASGVGVCMPNLRPDIHDWVGPAGFVYDSLDEVVEILQQPYPASMRRAGFEHARRADIREHLPLLTNLWKQA
jgi:hypothetical protein